MAAHRDLDRWIDTDERPAWIVVNPDGTSIGSSSTSPTLAAGENHIGSVGSNTADITVNPTVANTSHAADDVVGGRITLTNWARVSGGGTRAMSMTVRYLGSSPPDGLDFVFFNTTPSTNTADDAAFSWGASNVDAGAPCIGHVRVLASEFTVVSGVSICTKSLAGLGLVPSGSANLYLYIKNLNVFTFATNGLWLTFNPDRD